MIREYFVYNIPLFFSKARVQKRLKRIFGDVEIDIFQCKTNKSSHRGLARIESKYDLETGRVDFGTKYPIFVNVWIDKSLDADITSDEKTCSTDITDNYIDTPISFEFKCCESTDIYPVAQKFALSVPHVISLTPVPTDFVTQRQESFDIHAYICDKCQIYCGRCFVAANHFNSAFAALVGKSYNMAFPLVYSGFKKRI